MKKDKCEPVHSERVQKLIEQFKIRTIDRQKISDKEFSEYFAMNQLKDLSLEELNSFQQFLNQEEKTRKIRRVK